MSPRQSNPSLLVRLVDLSVQLRSDEDRSRQELRKRDREIGRELADLKRHPRQQLDAWLTRVCDPQLASTGQRVQRTHRLVLTLLVAGGLITGAVAAGIVFFYDGSHPVNVIHALVVFVGAQAVLLALLGLTLIPQSVMRIIPGAVAVQDGVSLLSPGRFVHLVTRLMPSSTRARVSGILGAGRSHVTIHGREQKWAVIHSSQVFAVAFYVGVLLRAMYLVAFSDLAFSWSTTLNVDPEEFHGVTSALARPWVAWFPAADPSSDLIERSRYFRLEGTQEAAAVEAAVLGGWWPFLIACIAGYGLAPRLGLLALSVWRLHAAMARTLLHLPGVPALLDRLNAELIETGAESPESPSSPATMQQRGDTAHPSAALETACVVIDWAEVGLSEDAIGQWTLTMTRRRPLALFDAGGRRTPAGDAEIIAAVAGTDAGHPIWILVRSWEPPLAEFVEFVDALRQRVGQEREIQVIPIGIVVSDEPTAAEPQHLGQWQRRLAQVGDPWLRVLSPMEGSM